MPKAALPQVRAMIAHLPQRSVLCVSGVDRVAFLQGLVSNDVTAAVPGQAVWAALLTPQGKWLADFFITVENDTLLLDVEAAQASLIAQRLLRYRLRAAVVIAPDPRPVYVGWDEAMHGTPDPRVAAAGFRVIGPATATASADDYDRHRLALGLPDGSRDLDSEKTTLLEAGFDALHGVSWTKGCYMGQELTARTKYRGLVKRRLLPVRVDGPLPAVGSPILGATGEVGTMRSGQPGLGLALLRSDAITERLTCCDAILSVQLPAWMQSASGAG